MQYEWAPKNYKYGAARLTRVQIAGTRNFRIENRCFKESRAHAAKR
jgi:hypothetical protein